MQCSGGAKVIWHSPCACPTAVLDVGSWCDGSRRGGCLGGSRRYEVNDAYQLDDEDEELAPQLEEDVAAGGGTKGPRWRVLLRRIVKGKRRIFRSGVAMPRVPYDPHTYAQNFEDPGSATWMETEDLGRSFSARFADPSRALRSIG